MKCSLPEQSRLSQVHLRTADLDRAVAFYGSVLGLKATPQSDQQTMLSATKNGPALLVLTENSNAAPRPSRTTGLYHFALRYPNRQELARAAKRLYRTGYPISGASDHAVSEAIYLSDPEGNGIELYADRPRKEWVWQNGEVEMVTRPLDFDILLANAPGESGEQNSPPPELGHIHLQVADLGTAERFYHEFLSLAVTQRSYPGALFFAAGAYHHHVGVNTWGGKTASPPNSLGLISYRVEVPVNEILYCLGHRAPLMGYETRFEAGEGDSHILQIRDPNGNWLEVQPLQDAAIKTQHTYQPVS